MNIEQLVTHLAGRIAQGMRPSDEVSRRYLDALRRLGEHALTKWSAASAAGIQCGVEVRQRRNGATHRCGAPAAGSCVVCSKPTCIDHALVSVADGRIICDGCVVAVASHYGSPPPPRRPKDQGEAYAKLRVLGLAPGATLGEIKFAHRTLVKRYHPDGKIGRNAERAEAKMKQINAAYSWLLAHYQEQGAA